VVAVTLFAVAGLDPYVNLATTMTGVGTLGIVVLQAAAALSVLGFFRRRADRHWWRTGVAPALGFAGLAASAVLVVRNFAMLTGTRAAAVDALPWLLLVVAVAGFGFAHWVRLRHPRRYAALAAVESFDERPAVVAPPEVIRPSARELSRDPA
jgi:hypothetical protein